ncbi:MAG: hypothetical protein ACLUWL_03040 [Bifidobacterium longum]
MNQQEQATQHAAIFQDTINGTNDPTPWPVTMWASSGDTIWTAGTARTAGEDSVGMIYDPGDTIVHRNTIAGDVTRATESFAIRPADGQSPMDAMLAGIEQWNHRHPDRWDTVATPGQYRMTDPTTGRQLPMGWSASLAAAASAAGRLDPDQAAISILQGQPISPTPALPQQEQPERDTDPTAVTQTPARTAAATKQVWPNAWVANRLAHTYILHAKDGRDWPKMIVGLPRGTAIDGKDLTGWATDMFMSAKNQRQKNEGRAVNIRFRPGTPVELFTGRGAERRTMQVDPQTLVQAVIDAQKRNRDAEKTLDTASVELASKTVEESWPQIERMQGRFTEYQRAGTYKPSVAMKWARRLVDRTAGEDEGRWTNRQRRQAARLLIQELTGTQDPTQARSKTTDRPTVEQYVPEGGKTPDAIGDETPAPPRKTETDMATKQRQDPIVPASQSPAAGPERRHTDLKSTLDRFRTRLKKNLDGLNADPPTAGTDRNRGQRKTL